MVDYFPRALAALERLCEQPFSGGENELLFRAWDGLAYLEVNLREKENEQTPEGVRDQAAASGTTT